MHFLSDAFHWLMKIDDHIGHLITTQGPFTYLILGLILFAETGLVVTPFLPGDTLLFAAGVFCNVTPRVPDPLNLYVVLIVFSCAPILGDIANYHIGKHLGQWLCHHSRFKLFSPQNLSKTHKFFEKYGPKTVMLARWVPIVRTFSPFVAGMGSMPFPTFIKFSSLGAVLWVWVCVGAGYFFGGFSFVKENFSLAMVAMIGITVLPIVFEIFKARREARMEAAAGIVEPAFCEPEVAPEPASSGADIH
jgi:membrane-associated protein